MQSCKFYTVDKYQSRVGEWVDADNGTLVRIDLIDGGYTALVIDHSGQFVKTPIEFVKVNSKPVDQIVSGIIEGVLRLGEEYVSKNELSRFKRDVINLNK